MCRVNISGIQKRSITRCLHVEAKNVAGMIKKSKKITNADVYTIENSVFRVKLLCYAIMHVLFFWFLSDDWP